MRNKETKELQRLIEIQEKITEFVSKELKDKRDPMYMATMMLQHTMLLYKTFLTDDEITQLLGTVSENLYIYEYEENITLH